MEKSLLATRVFETAYLRGDFLLRSGQRSTEYFDKYRFESNPDLLASIAEHMVDLIPSGIEGLAALEMGGIPIAVALSLKTNIPVCFVRKEAKKYGTAKFAEGMEIKGKKLLVIEDVITSGGQVIESTKDLRGEGAIIDHVLCVIDREQGGREKLAMIDLNMQSLFTMTELKASKV